MAGGLSLLVDIAPTCAGPFTSDALQLCTSRLVLYVVLDDTGDSWEAGTMRVTIVDCLYCAFAICCLAIFDGTFVYTGGSCCC